MTVAETGLGSTSGKIFKATAVMISKPKIATNVTTIPLTTTLLIERGMSRARLLVNVRFPPEADFRVSHARA